MTPEKLSKIVDPVLSTTLSVKMLGLAASLSEPYSFYIAAMSDLKYEIKIIEENVYSEARKQKDDKGRSVSSVDDARIEASKETRDKQKDLLRMENIAVRIKNILARVDNLSSAYQSHANSLKAMKIQGGIS
jgi:hypothetical protein